MKKTFLKNVLPSMLAFAFSGVYAIVDGFFIGRNIGDIGLAAINLAYPIVALIQSIGTGIGMGGAIHISISRGIGNKNKASKYMGNTFFLLIVSCILLTIILGLTHYPVLKLFGAEGDTLKLANEYIRIIIAGAAFQVLSTGLIPLLRNHNKAMFAMFAMVAGFVTNIILDYLFVAVLPYGMAGAAWATIIGQGVTMIPCVIILLSIKYRVPADTYKPEKSVVKDILITGISPFGLTISPNIVIMIMNKAAMSYGGALAVTSYAVISYVVCVIQLLLQGVGDGSQPLMSYYIGKKNNKSANAICNMAYLLACFVAVICIIAIIALKKIIPPFFGASSEVTIIVEKAIPIFAVGFIFAAFMRVTTSYFYATKKNILAYIMVYGEPIVLLILITLVFPHIFGINGVWMSVPITQVILSIVGIIFLTRKNITSN